MKRIINVSYFSSVRLKNCFVNDINKKITNGFIRNGYEVINYSDREMLRFFSILGMKTPWTYKNLQQHFVDFCIKYKPDAIVMCHADKIAVETLKQVKEKLPNIKILQYNLDSLNPFLPAAVINVNKLTERLDVVDATLVTTGDEKFLQQFKRPGNYVGFLPNIADKSLETGHAYKHEQLDFDISFGGTNDYRDFCGKETLYMDIVNSITNALPKAKLNIFGLKKKNKVEGPEYQDIFANSAIGLNLSRISNDYLYSSDRMAHIMGNGVLCMLEENTGFKDIFSDDEVAYYKTPEEFLEKLKFYVDNPKERMRVAKNGHDKYIEHFNEVNVTKYMADILFGKLNKKDYIWTQLVDIKDK